MSTCQNFNFNYFNQTKKGFGSILGFIPTANLNVGNWWFRFDPYRTPSLVIALMFIVSFLMMLIWFDEIPYEDHKEELIEKSDHSKPKPTAPPFWNTGNSPSYV